MEEWTLKDNFTRMIDKNGKTIHEDSLMKYLAYPLPLNETGNMPQTFCIARASDILHYHTSIVFVFDNMWHKNPCEVEVVTEDEAILEAFKGNVRLKFERKTKCI
jgi:hypothetical protein